MREVSQGSAEKLWCPFVRGRRSDLFAETGKHHDRCIGGRCMMWDWTNHKDKLGRCRCIKSTY